MNEDLIATYLAYKLHNEGRSIRTIANYRLYLQQLSRYLESPLPQAQLTQLKDYVGLHLHQRGLTPRSRRAVVAAIKGFYRWLYQNQLLTNDLATALPYPYSGYPLPMPLELHYAEKLLLTPDINTFTGLRDATIIATLLGTGMRVSGITSLNESHLLFLPTTNGHEELLIRVTEKGKKQREIPVTLELWALLRAYLGHPFLEEIDRTTLNGDRVLFINLRNRCVTKADHRGDKRRLTSVAIWNLIRFHGRLAKIPDVQLHPHAMRHLYGQQLAEQGVDLNLRKALMGHESADTVAIYDHLARDAKRRAVNQANPLRRIKTPASALVNRLSANR